MKILFTDAKTVISEGITLDSFKEFGNIAVYDNLTQAEIKEKAKDADAIICNKSLITREIIESAPNLKYIGIFATGYNNIDAPAAREYGITVCNAGQYSTNSVAQQVFAYILNFANRVHDYDEDVKRGLWENSDIFCIINHPMIELAGKTIGIVGYGNIGKQVAKIADAFKMNVLVHTRSERESGVNYVSFEELLERSDFITVHCPLTEQTKGLFDGRAFSKCKDGCYFINTSRGPVVDENALLYALESGKLSGAALDVLESEPIKSDCVLKSAPNIIITPHIAWAPLETRKRLVNIVYDNLKEYLKGTPKNIVI